MKGELPIAEQELQDLETRYKHWEEIPKGQYPCSWAALGRLLATVRSLQSQSPRSRSKKQKIEDDLRRSDLTAQLTDRDDIEYGHHETLPRGEHVVNARKR